MSADPTHVLGRVRRGVAWTGLAGISVHLINLARVMVVARLLAPADFGVFGMAMVVMLGFSALGQLGIKEAFIAHEQADEAERDRWLFSLWTVNLLARLVLAALIAALAWPAARLYGQPVLLPMLVTLSLVPLLTGLNNPAFMLLEKRIAFGRIAAFELSVALAGFVVTVLLAWLLNSAWALIIGQVAAPLAGVIVSYRLYPMRVRLAWDPRAVVQALNFGKYILVASILGVVITQLDNLAVGVQLGAAALGLYVIAYRMSEIPKLVIASAAVRTLFPYYAERMREGRAALAAAWLESFGYIFWLVLAAYIPIAFCAEYVVVTLFGAQWRAAAPVLVVLALLSAIRSLNSTLGALLMTVRKTRAEALIKGLEVTVFVPGVFVGLALAQAPVGAAWAGALAMFVGLLARGVYSIRTLRVPGGVVARRFARPLAGGVLMAAIGLWGAADWPPLGLAVAMVAVWAGMLLILEPGLRRWLATYTIARRA